MASKSRIYMVSDYDLKQRVLVRAISAAQAVAHVTRPRFTAAVATQDELVTMLKDGEDVLDATKDAE